MEALTPNIYVFSPVYKVHFRQNRFALFAQREVLDIFQSRCYNPQV